MTIDTIRTTITNRREEWLDVQARALYQAFRLICRAVEGGTL